MSKILFLLRENKIHIFAPPCNILYIQCFTMHGKLVIEQEDFFTESLSKENYYLSAPLPVDIVFLSGDYHITNLKRSAYNFEFCM